MNQRDLDEESEATPPFARDILGEGHDREPLRHYAVFASTFLCTSTWALRALRAKGYRMRSPRATDVLLLGLATNRLSRLMTREKVTRVLRAPFTDVDADADPEEVHEHPHGRGLRRGIGELVTCPRCFAMWAAAGLSLLYVRSPTTARFAATVLSAAAISDYVNQRFTATKTIGARTTAQEVGADPAGA